jgi:hypothetical protein
MALHTEISPAPAQADQNDTLTTETDYQTVLARLQALLQEKEEDEYGVLRPTKSAFDLAMHLICEAKSHMKIPFPRASVATDTEGGIHFYWKRPNREVRLAVPADETGSLHIYHREESETDLDTNVSGASLAQWLTWLAEP